MPTQIHTVNHGVALTFDDGPKQHYTPRLLQALGTLRATMFFCGRDAEIAPDLVRAAFDAGIEIANHTYSHPNLDNVRDADLADQIERTSTILDTITGRPPALFRPPYGALPPRVALHIEALGMQTVLWNRDPGDWRSPPPAVTIACLRAAKSGDIVLMHERDNTIEAITAVAEQGFLTNTVTITQGLQR